MPRIRACFPFLYFPTFPPFHLSFSARYCRENVFYNAVPATEPSQQHPSWLKKANEPNHDSHITQFSIKLSSVSVSKSSTTRHVAGAAASLPYNAPINIIHHCSYWDRGPED
ncbi:hypothetical protein BOTNAR_0027g00460 [Botryotinia narcissicola]|uniref:Uncharacterized protein n=1 Tax=Botryotinia narcissicola TaxID=278944 RepID=A0A4Z1JH44_9HELO|nr:hypothetical protein BOTNAR_0027g00460 [Botryotinia narcissicola]